MSTSRDRAYGQKVEPTEVRVDPARAKISKREGIVFRWVFLAFVAALITPGIIWIWRLALGVG